MSLRVRIEALERRTHAGQIILVMPDGSEVKITADPAKLMFAAFDEWHAGELSDTTKLIAKSVDSIEPGRSHMLDVVRAMLVENETEEQ